MRNEKLVNLLEIIASSNMKQADLPKNTYGMAHYQDMLIEISIHQTPRARVATLIHEALHFYYWEKNIKRSERSIEAEAQRITKRLYGKQRS